MPSDLVPFYHIQVTEIIFVTSETPSFIKKVKNNFLPDSIIKE